MTNGQFLRYLYENKTKLEITWEDIADIMNDLGEDSKTGDAYRLLCKRRFGKIEIVEDDG